MTGEALGPRERITGNMGACLASHPVQIPRAQKELLAGSNAKRAIYVATVRTVLHFGQFLGRHLGFKVSDHLLNLCIHLGIRHLIHLTVPATVEDFTNGRDKDSRR